MGQGLAGMEAGMEAVARAAAAVGEDPEVRVVVEASGAAEDQDPAAEVEAAAADQLGHPVQS